ncbi:MAG: hypothetical protein HUJ72_10340 [Blautia sp.]|nr:hypothetical protein [Blautia sp.]
MSFMEKLERKFGKLGIPNLTLYIIICYVIGYLLMYVNPGLLNMMNLNVSMILKGQIWRVITWIVSPPSSGNVLLFVVAVLFFYYPIGNMLERAWGSFRYTLYILSGILFTVAGAFILHFITGGMIDVFASYIFTTYYISLSVFLAYALCFPDMQIYLYFVIPIKMKWMAYLYVALMAYDIIKDVRMGIWYMSVPIVASLLNFVLFFFGTRNVQRVSPKEIKRKKDFARAMSMGQARSFSAGVNKKNGPAPAADIHGARHKCAICGRTELDNADLEFRFCSKCNGNYEYCQDHLFTHMHVQ